MLRAIVDPQFPSAIAMYMYCIRVAKACALPVPTYLMHCFNSEATLSGLRTFDLQLGSALSARLVLGVINN